MSAQLAIVTMRPGVKARYAAAGVDVAAYCIQEGGHWPQIPDELPIVLDTIGMPPDLLIQLLSWVPDTLVVIAEPEALLTLRLLAMSQDVQLVLPDDPNALRQCQRFVPNLIPGGQMGWMIPPPPLALAWRLEQEGLAALRVLAALREAQTMQAAAKRRGVSKATLSRQLAALRRALGLPPGREKRDRPSVHAAQILEWLAQGCERELAA